MNIALIAHDKMKDTMVGFCIAYERILQNYGLYATGTTGKRIMDETSLNINRLASGPLGGDQQIGAMIAEGKLDALIFFCDNLITQGHAQDIQALARLASLYNVAYANNRTTADMIITSPLFNDPNYERIIPSCIEKYASRFN